MFPDTPDKLDKPDFPMLIGPMVPDKPDVPDIPRFLASWFLINRISWISRIFRCFGLSLGLLGPPAGGATIYIGGHIISDIPEKQERQEENMQREHKQTTQWISGPSP